MINNQNIKFLIHEFLEGNLSESQTEELWAELLGRPEELEYLETLSSLQLMGQAGTFDDINETPVHQLADKSEQVHTGTFSSLRQYLVAASILIAGMLVLYNVFPDADPAAGIAPIAAIEYDIERSAETATRFESHLQQAVSLSASGNMDVALTELTLAEDLELSEGQRIELEMVRGSVYYNSAEYTMAAAIFDGLSSRDSIDNLNLEKSLWYLANTQIHLNDAESARANINKVIELDGAFSRVAKSMLERMNE